MGENLGLEELTFILPKCIIPEKVEIGIYLVFIFDFSMVVSYYHAS